MAANGTTWKPGQSGNPGGRPRIAREVRASAQGDSPEAYRVILGIMRDGDKDAARLAAAVRVLQLAGIPMSEDKTPEPNEPRPLPTDREPTVDDLEAAAAKGEC